MSKPPLSRREERKRRLVARGEMYRASIDVSQEVIRSSPLLNTLGMVQRYASGVGGQIGRMALTSIGPFLLRKLTSRSLALAVAGFVVTTLITRMSQRKREE